MASFFLLVRGDADPTSDLVLVGQRHPQCSIIHIREERPFLDLSSDMIALEYQQTNLKVLTAFATT